MSSRHFALPLLSAAALALCSLSNAAFAAASVGDDNGDAIKGTTKVAIAEFGVEFFTQINAQGRAGGASASVTSALSGVSDATLQGIADQAYADTVAALKGAGFEVLDQSALNGDAGYQELASKYGQPSPYTLTDDSFGAAAPFVSKTFAPAGMKAFLSTSTGRGDFRQRTDSQNQGRGDKEGALAKSVGATLLHVHYLASFGAASGTKNGVLSSIAGKARAKVDLQPMLFAEDTEIQFVTSAGKRTFTNSHRPRHTGAVYLKSALVSDAEIFTTRENTPEATKRGDRVFNAVSGLLGSGAGNKSKTSEVTVESEDAFRTQFQTLISEAGTALVNELAGSR